jgi:hypothetical protein
MANPIVVSCPECKKSMKAPEELRGKKVRCKACNHTFTLPAPEPPPPSDDAESYGVIREESSIPRCPHCAQVLQSEDAVICIHCGYNMRTRQRVGTRKVVETTGGEQFHWLLPGILCVVGIVALIGFDLWFCLIFPKKVDPFSDWDMLNSNGVRLWAVIATLFLMFFMGKFAFSRLILNSTPPEKQRDI